MVFITSILFLVLICWRSLKSVSTQPNFSVFILSLAYLGMFYLQNEAEDVSTFNPPSISAACLGVLCLGFIFPSAVFVFSSSFLPEWSVELLLINTGLRSKRLSAKLDSEHQSTGGWQSEMGFIHLQPAVRFYTSAERLCFWALSSLTAYQRAVALKSADESSGSLIRGLGVPWYDFAVLDSPLVLLFFWTWTYYYAQFDAKAALMRLLNKRDLGYICFEGKMSVCLCFSNPHKRQQSPF